MSTYCIEINDEVINDQISAILDTVLKRELANRYTSTDREISAAVKDLIYTRKDEIIERVVDKAVRELVKKGLPKLMERIEQ